MLVDSQHYEISFASAPLISIGMRYFFVLTIAIMTLRYVDNSAVASICRTLYRELCLLTVSLLSSSSIIGQLPCTVIIILIDCFPNISLILISGI